MGGYGHNLSNLLKNSRREERKAYDGWTEGDQESQGIEVAPVSEKVLEEIRQKLRRQQKQVRKRNILIVAMTILLLVLVIWGISLHFQDDPGVSFGPYR